MSAAEKHVPTEEQQRIERTIRWWKRRLRVCEWKLAAYREELEEAKEAVEGLEREWWDADRK